MTLGVAAAGELAGAFAADDDGAGGAAEAAAPAKSAAAAAGRRRGSPAGQARDPREREVLDGRLVDLLERAVAPAGVVARVGRPRVGERLANRGGIEAALCLARDGTPATASLRAAAATDVVKISFLDRHFSVTR